VPELDPAAIQQLLATLAGHTDTETCDVTDSPAPAPTSLVGFVTADVLNDCSDTLHTPLDDGYFEAGGEGLASNANVLSGDLMLLDGRETSSAFAFDAVPVVADAARFAQGLNQSFYRGFESDRLPLDVDYSARFLNGVGPGTTTDFIVWLNPFVRGTFVYVVAGLSFFDEQGLAAGFLGRFEELKTPFLIDVSEILVYKMPPPNQEPLDVKAGSVEISATWDSCPVCSPPLFLPHQLWTAPLYSAAGGLSVRLGAVQRSPTCASPKTAAEP
jgi:hypothetical protein